MRKTYVCSLIFLVALAQYPGISPTQARWATYQDASAEVDLYNSETIVDKDGKSEEIVEKKVRILNESGRASFSVERLHFNENIEKIEILEAKTIINGKEHHVPKEMIETKPLASDTRGFDQLFQILISYPHVCVGTTLCLKYKVKTLKQPLPNYFAVKHYYGGHGAYWKRATLKIKSELPFHVLANDPHDRAVIKNGREGKYYSLEIHSKKPAYDHLINEPETNQIPDRLKTWVSLSTFDRFEDFSRACAKDYEDVINQKLPPLQESIKKAAALISNPVDQINAVTSLLSEKIRYMGDWRTVEGRLSPRSLKAVAESGVGDCKDFSASVAAILRSLGYKAQIALVMRGTLYLPPEKSLPSFLNINHAIVKVTTKNNRVFWVDPTNFTSMADGIFPDIADRPALVLDPRNPSCDHIPSIDYERSRVTFEDSMEIKDDGVLSNAGSVEFSGEEAQEFTGAGLSHSLQSIKESIIKLLTGETNPIKHKIILPPLTSRIVKNFKIDYAYEQADSLLLTNAGPGILLKRRWSRSLIDTSDCQEGTTFIGLPMTLTKKITIKDVDAKQTMGLAYDVKSPWVKAKRELRVVDQGLEIREEVSFLKSFITADEIKSKQFKELKGILKKYCHKLAIIVSRKGKKKSDASPLATGG